MPKFKDRGLHIIGKRPSPINILVRAKLTDDGKAFETEVLDAETKAPIAGVAALRYEVAADRGAVCSLIFAPNYVSLEIEGAPATGFDLPAQVLNVNGTDPVNIYEGRTFTIRDAQGRPAWLLRAEPAPADLGEEAAVNEGDALASADETPDA